MQFLDARRLTGPNLLFDGPATVLDVACKPAEADAIEEAWRAAATRLIEVLGRGGCRFARRDFEGGTSFAFTAPIDSLYAATEINERAFAMAAAAREGREAPDFGEAVQAAREAHAGEANLRMLALEAAAANHGVTFLWDDDEVSLGTGRGSTTWPCRQLPAADEVDWQSFSDIPAALVTGTNGKTTTVRIARRILRVRDLDVGLSSTDWLAVNDEIIDRGDWSGPGGARTVLRRRDVDAAILETARGGLLRRGLGVQHADAALITNIAADHLGDFGSHTIDELLDVKWLVSRAVEKNGRLILNADDERLVARAANYPGRLVWFSLDADNRQIASHLAAGGCAFYLEDGDICLSDGGEAHKICAAADIPITFAAAARHNIANALAAGALTWCLGADSRDIAKGLVSMSQEDNPGRSNVVEVAGRKILIDFAHNPHAMQALYDMAAALPAKRRILCFGQAGDRPDDLIREMTRAVFRIGLDRVIVSELARYHRGREPGEVYAVIRDELQKLGLGPERIGHYEEEVESLDAALAASAAGDLIIMLALGGAGPIREHLEALDS